MFFKNNFKKKKNFLKKVLTKQMLWYIIIFVAEAVS